MKVFLAFLKKEFYHILRDKRTLLILFIMPVTQVLIFGYAVTNEFKDARIDVLDNSRSPLSREYINHLQSSGHFQLNQSITNYRDIEEGMKAGNSKFALVIPHDFSTDFLAKKQPEVQLLADGSDPNNATTLVQYVNQMSYSFINNKFPNSTQKRSITVSSRMLYNPQLESAYNFIPGVIAMILLIISAMLTSLTIAKEKEQGTMEILLVSPLSPFIIILGKVVPYAILSFINALIILLLGTSIFDVPIRGSIILLLLMCLLYVIVALALGILISTAEDTQQGAMMKSMMGLMLPTMILSGFMFPLSSMPQVLQGLGHIVPATYFIEILKAIMLRGTGLLTIWLSTLVLIGMAIVLLGLAIRNFKIRLQ
ncbi:ABC transporter permease [Aquimarina sp. U1-2]|uniref:ABC transporter permease n=1 Tax=Aquimarina sp. U1-2 TaxID=2823141 RepID=UPI001AECF7F5|nr:ABC transporter permease [Aquimarina sp. U1-2]MBP2831027.1 ABC transporter permease [Aquimarina sp. U1-2]